MNMDLSLYVGNDDLRFVLNEKKIIYQKLNLPMRLLESKMQTMMTYNPKYDHEFLELELKKIYIHGRREVNIVLIERKSD